MSAPADRRASWLRNRPPKEWLDRFDEDGYLVIPDALTADHVARLNEVVDRVDAEQRNERGLSDFEVMARFDAVMEDDALLELCDWPKTFPLVWDVLGWNVHLYMSHLIVYPPEPDSEAAATRAFKWHQDGGRPVVEMERPHPRLSFKIGFWLSDTRGEDSGAMCVVPGSHRLDALPPGPPGSRPEGMVELREPAGTAVAFDRRLFHARSVNRSRTTRKSLFLGYAFRWLRGLDHTDRPPQVLHQHGPIRRQLLGDGKTIKGHWQPEPEDVPLRTFLGEQGLLGDPPVFPVRRRGGPDDG